MIYSVATCLQRCSAALVIASIIGFGNCLGDELDWSSPRPIQYSTSDQGPLPRTPDQIQHNVPSVAKAPAMEIEPLFPIPSLGNEQVPLSAQHAGGASANQAERTSDAVTMVPHRVVASSQRENPHDSERPRSQAGNWENPMARLASASPLVPSLPEPTVSHSVPAATTAEPRPKLPPPQVGTATVSGWQLGRLASQRIARAQELFQRRSPMAARQRSIEALHLLAQATDEVSRSHTGTDALSQAMTAVREASDFLGRFGTVDTAALQRLVDAHQTRILKHCELSEMTALSAADTYYEFARGRFVDAVSGWSCAANALIIIAKTEPLSQQASDSNLSAAQVCYLRTAITCDPGNAVASNELGHELLAVGMYDEARWALEHSYQQQPSEAALDNLAQLHRIVGNPQLAQACAANMAAVRNNQPRVAQVMQLSPEQFAHMSPIVMEGPKQSSAGRAQVMYPERAGGQAKSPPGVLHPGDQQNRVERANPSRGRVAGAVDRASNSLKSIFR